jgi:purine nucleosidase
MATKILLDTDIGSDIDDAVCLAYLLAQPACELLGITTVTGEAVKRAQMASVICTMAGRNIPIYPGCENPILVPQQQPRAPQAVRVHKWEHDEIFPRGEAIEFMRQTIREYPGEVVLLTIAPLTNIGLLFSVDPEIPSLLKGLVMMCGRFGDAVPAGYGPLEWNASGDPHASAIVYRSNVKLHRSLGLDVTHRVTMNPDQFRSAFSRFRLFRPVLDFAEVWFKDWNGTTFHDPLAAASIFDDSICTFQKGTVKIELEDAKSRGLTNWTPEGSDAPHEVGVDVNPERFFKHFLSVF